MRFTGETVLVTGGAGGIGRAVAGGLAAEDARVVVADLDGAAARAVAQEVGGEGVELDVCDRARVAAVFAELTASATVDAVVHCAGLNTRTPFLAMAEQEFEHVVRVNLLGTFLVLQASVRGMLAAGTRGRIVLLSSMSAFVPVGLAHYEAAKAGVGALTRAVAREFAPQGIRINALAPGVVETRLTADTLNDPTTRSNRLARIPVGRFGTPADLVPMAVLLASRECSFTTGSIVTMDGGQCLQ